MIEAEYVRQIPRRQYEYEQVRINISGSSVEEVEVKLHEARVAVEREMQTPLERLLSEPTADQRPPAQRQQRPSGRQSTNRQESAMDDDDDPLPF